MATRPLDRPGARMLNHVELAYAPGERALARQLLEALGFRVIDPQTDPIPENLGPAAAPYLIVYLDSDDGDVFDNVMYASQANEAQWRFECALRSLAVLGFFGYETIGREIEQAFQSTNYGEVWTHLYVLMAVIILFDAWSGQVRKRFVA